MKAGLSRIPKAFLICSKYLARATFFTLGYIAEKYPELIEEVKSKGNEIASYGFSHTDIRNDRDF
jgi:peptidoglycan/xylan/chitin deacetylase (PgdA/CDA1 family)